jgi:hypothetical protein
LRIAGFCQLKQLEFDARRTRVDDEDRIHGGQAAGKAAVLRRAAA